jgi:hypothetical protein
MYIPEQLEVVFQNTQPYAYAADLNAEVLAARDRHCLTTAVSFYGDKANFASQLVSNEAVGDWKVSPMLSNDNKVKVSHPVHGYSVLLNISTFLKYASKGWHLQRFLLCYKDKPNGVALGICTEDEAQEVSEKYKDNQLFLLTAECGLTTGDIISSHFAEEGEKLVFLFEADGKYYFLSKATGMLYQEEFINTYVRHGMEDNLTDLAVIVNIVRAKHAGNVRATLKGPLNIKSMTDAMPENLDLTPDTLRSWMALCTTLVVPIHRRHCQTFWEQNPSYIRVVEQFQDLKLVKVKKGFQVKCTRGTERYTGQKGVVLPFEEAGLIFLKVLYSFKLYWTNAETALEREGELISVRSMSSAKSEIAVPSNTY